MSSRRIALALVLCEAVAGCASIPDVALTYYLPKATAQVSVTQVFRCEGAQDSDKPARAASVSISPVAYVKDPDRTAQLRYKGNGADITDLDLAVSLTDDGRLTGINSSATGQGNAVITGIIGLAAIAVAARTPQTDVCSIRPENAPREAKIIIADNPLRNLRTCEKFPKRLKDKDNNISVIYTGRLDTLKDSTTLMLTVDPSTREAFEALFGAGNETPFWVKVTVANLVPPFPVAIPPRAATDTGTLAPRAIQLSNNPDAVLSGYRTVFLNGVGTASILVYGYATEDQDCAVPFLREDNVPVPSAETYALPLPRYPIFGTVGFALTLSGAGSVTKLEYSKKGAAADAFASLNAIGKEAFPSAADQAAQLKAEADLVAQRYRLAACKVDPANCPK